MDTKTTDRPETVRTYETVTAATVTLGSKTYTGTVAAGGGVPR
jgi:hypothetical protein